jgi:neutral ceramidase
MVFAHADTVDLTPTTSLPVACNGPINEGSSRVALPLEANILGLRGHLGEQIVVVSLDWFFGSPDLRSRILERCKGGLESSSLFIAASHTHTSPATDRTKVGFSAVDEAYVEAAEHAIAERVSQMMEREWPPGELKYVTIECDCAVNRRALIWRPDRGFRRVLASHPNWVAPRDRELRLLSIEVDGRPVALVWGVSCHPTEWPRPREISSDYPGLVRHAMRTELGQPLPVLFLQGFCGDLRPPAIGRWKPTSSSLPRRLAAFGGSLLNGPGFSPFTETEYESWVNALVSRGLSAVRLAGLAEPLRVALASHRSTVPIAALGVRGKTAELSCHWFDLSAGLRLVGMSAEVCWDYREVVQRAFPSMAIWPVGYIDEVFGYLPTRKMLDEGGYEVSGFKAPFGITGEFLDSLEDQVAALVAS